MIVADKKPVEEIIEYLKDHQNILILGCNECVTVCEAGGQKEVQVLASALRMNALNESKEVKIDEITLERQCDHEYLEEIRDVIDQYDAVVSLACGVGIQFLAERFPNIPVYPAVDTCGLAVNQAVGWYEERCRSCSSCVLGLTAGICPVTMCAKGLYNGPCGGTNQGSCEINTEQPCAWYMIYERLEKQGRLDCILKITPAVDWHNQVPRTLIQPGYKKPEEAVKK